MEKLKKLIKETDVYKRQPLFKKRLITKRNNVKQIEHSLKVIENRGFDLWNSQTNSNYMNRLIIEEILKN